MLKHILEYIDIDAARAEILVNWENLDLRYQLIRKAYKAVEDKEYIDGFLNLPMTPIEEKLWREIKTNPFRSRMYREFPVGKYFVDFGDPWVKLAIEADGEKFHDPKKDMLRDRVLESMGWEVKRVEGKDCRKRGILNGILEDYYR